MCVDWMQQVRAQESALLNLQIAFELPMSIDRIAFFFFADVPISRTILL